MMFTWRHMAGMKRRGRKWGKRERPTEREPCYSPQTVALSSFWLKTSWAALAVPIFSQFTSQAIDDLDSRPTKQKSYYVHKKTEIHKLSMYVGRPRYEVRWNVVSCFYQAITDGIFLSKNFESLCCPRSDLEMASHPPTIFLFNSGV